MSFLGSVFKIAKGVVTGFAKGGPIGAVAGGGKAVVEIAFRPKPVIPMQPLVDGTDWPLPIDRFAERVDRQSPAAAADPPQFRPGGIEVGRHPSTLGAEHRPMGPAIAPAAPGSDSDPGGRWHGPAKKKKRKKAKAKAKRPKKAKGRKLKFGSPAWRRKYLRAA